MSYSPGMRLFGSPDAFAVQVEPRGPFDERWKFGHLQFWVDGHSLGDWDDSASLASAARWGRTFLAHSFERFRPDLDSWSARDILAELYEQFLVDRPADVQPAPYAKSWSRDPFLLDDVAPLRYSIGRESLQFGPPPETGSSLAACARTKCSSACWLRASLTPSSETFASSSKQCDDPVYLTPGGSRGKSDPTALYAAR